MDGQPSDLAPPGNQPQLAYQGFRSAPGRTRTCDARFRKPTLYPLSYGSSASSLPNHPRWIRWRSRPDRAVASLQRATTSSARALGFVST